MMLHDDQWEGLERRVADRRLIFHDGKWRDITTDPSGERTLEWACAVLNRHRYCDCDTWQSLRKRPGVNGEYASMGDLHGDQAAYFTFQVAERLEAQP